MIQPAPEWDQSKRSTAFMKQLEAIRAAGTKPNLKFEI